MTSNFDDLLDLSTRVRPFKGHSAAMFEQIFTRSRHCFGIILILFLTSIKLFNGIFITMLRSATTIEFDDNDSSQ